LVQDWLWRRRGNATFYDFMVPAQKTESCAPVMALSLFVVLSSAKVAMLAGRDVEFGPLVFADDAFIATVFAFVEWLTRKRRWIAIALYGTLVSYAAMNVPLARLTSSPLTVQMFRATGSALTDSIAHHLTPVNIFLIALLGVVATGLPFVMNRVPSRMRSSLLVWAILLGVIGCCSPPRDGHFPERVQHVGALGLAACSCALFA
jgi:hypothetical protein